MGSRPAPDEVAVEVRAIERAAGFSGVVVDAAPGLAPAVGDEVLGAIPAGARAERLVVCRRDALVRKPAALAHAEAAVLAGRGATALRAARLAGARLGERVLITGASGAVGAILVQIGKAWGWHVVAVCPDRDVPLVWDLGADGVHARERMTGDDGRFVAVIDTDLGLTAELVARLLQPEGCWLTIRGGAVQLATALGDAVVVEPEAPPSPDELAELVELVERGGLVPVRTGTAEEAG
jgi:NADPH:quinone reductase-like Zn-dependent oxidoreductase